MLQPTKDSQNTNGQVEAIPDISSETQSSVEGILEHVGMSSIEMPIWLMDPVSGEKAQQSALVDVFVNLSEPQVRGIHMSRLYLILLKGLQSTPLSFQLFKQLLKDFIQSQKGISEHSSLSVKFNLPVQRKALLSQEKGWRYYPIELSAKTSSDCGYQFYLSTQVTYSSTCPCSAALSRQLIQEQFKKDFPSLKAKINQTNSPDKNDSLCEEVTQWLGREESIVATPHAQRSHAKFKLELSEDINEIVDFIDLVEKSLGTPVQTLVKRRDEQEFARLNARQLMFCEDAARKIRKTLEKDKRIKDYWIRVEHLESLHPHNAVSIATKGIPKGFRA